jgi:hypothetical protein
VYLSGLDRVQLGSSVLLIVYKEAVLKLIVDFGTLLIGAEVNSQVYQSL